MGSFIKDVLSVGMSRMFIIAISLGSSIVTARYLGPENNGIIAALLVYPSLFMTIGSLGIRQSTTYFIGKEIYEEADVKSAITQIWFFSSVLSIIICFFLMTFLSSSSSRILLVILALLPIPFNLFVTYSSGVFLGKNQIREFNKVNWLPNFLTLAFTVLFVIFFDMGVVGAMLAMLGGPFFMFFLMLRRNKFVQSFNLQFRWDIIRALLKLGITYAVALLVINLNYRVDVLLLDRLSDPEQTGLYAKGAGITQYLWQIPMILSTIVFARSAASKNGKEFSHKASQLLRLSLIAVSSLSVLLFLVSDLLISLMYGEAFSGSTAILNILLPGVVILTFFKVLNMDLAGKGKPWVSMKAMVPGLIVNIALNLILIPEMGAKGAALSSTISYGIAGILFLFFYCSETGLSVGDVLRLRKSDFTPILNFIIKKSRNEDRKEF